MTLFVSSHASLLVTFGASEGFASRRLRTALPRARFFRVPLSLSRHSAPPFSAFGTGTSLGIAVGASSQPWGARPRVRGLRAAGQRAERSGAREAPCRLGARVRGEDFREGRHARSTAASRTPRAPYHTTRGCTYRTPSRTSSTPRCSRAYRASRRRGNRTPRDTDCVERRETGATRCRDGSELVSRKRATMLARRCRSKYRSVLHRAALLTPRPFPP
jgi:hypothetical protein